MATRRAGMPATAVFLAATGGFLVFLAIRNVPFVEGLRSVLRGSLPKGPDPTPADVPGELQFATGRIGSGLGGIGLGDSAPTGAVGSGTLGARIAQAALRYQGVPYRWGGADPEGWDCSGFVTWVLHRDIGLQLPSNVHTTSALFMAWRGARNVDRKSARPGDLLCWVGHIGINLGDGTMIHAPTFGQTTKIAGWMPNPVVRRVLPQ